MAVKEKSKQKDRQIQQQNTQPDVPSSYVIGYLGNPRYTAVHDGVRNSKQQIT